MAAIKNAATSLLYLLQYSEHIKKTLDSFY